MNSSSAVAQDCRSDMWLYSSENSSWVNVSQLVSPGQRCYHAVSVLQFKMFLSGGCTSVFGFALYSEERCKAAAAGLWLYDIRSPSIWLLLTETKTLLNPGTFSSISVWSFTNFSLPFLVSTSGAESDDGDNLFIIAAIGCPKGYNASNFTEGICTKCPKNSYSSHGQEKCTSCPPLLGTPSPGGTSVFSCTVCRDSNYCGKGICSVNSESLASGKFDEAVKCECQLGNAMWPNGNGKCKPDLYILVGFASVMFVFFLISLPLFGHWIWTKWKVHKKSSDIIADVKELATILPDNVVVPDGGVVKEGSYGKVFDARYGTETVKVKAFKKNSNETSIQKEIEVLARLRHPNVVVFHGSAKTRTGDFFMVMEQHPRSLHDFLVELRNKLRDEELSGPQILEKNTKQFEWFAEGIACGMEYLHRGKIIHGDLKPGNVLLTTTKVVKIADFGCARSVDEKKDRLYVNGRSSLNTAGRKGTFGYCAPEIWLSSQKPTLSVDVFRYSNLVQYWVN